MRILSAKDLKQRMDNGAPLKLLNALEAPKFEALHIPGSLNYLTREDIENNLSKDDEIVVYCTDFSCNKSILMYQLLDALGYKNIYRFAGGLAEWQREGYRLEGTQA